MKIRIRTRWTLALVGVLTLFFLGADYEINRVMVRTYFPNTERSAFGLIESFFMMSACYFILVAVSGEWKLWFNQ